MNKGAYFFDTYALFEIIGGNEAYAKYTTASAIITILNLAELNYGLKKEKGKLIADKITDKYVSLLVDVSVEQMKEAMDLKMKHKKLSIPDVIGYAVAKKHGVKFLTGDEGFRHLPNVEFVNK